MGTRSYITVFLEALSRQTEIQAVVNLRIVSPLLRNNFAVHVMVSHQDRVNERMDEKTDERNTHPECTMRINYSLAFTSRHLEERVIRELKGACEHGIESSYAGRS